MLVLDSFCGHTMEEVKTLLKKGKTDLVVIPSGLTSMLQPLDVCINRPFKFALKQKIRNGWPEGTINTRLLGKLKKPNLDLLCLWIEDTWDQTSPELVEKSFKKCSISNSPDGTEEEFILDNVDDHASSEDSNNDESDLIRGEHIFLFIIIAIPLIKRHQIPKCIGIATHVRNIAVPVLCVASYQDLQEQFDYGIKQSFL